MFNIFKSKFKPISEYPDTWQLAHSGEGDELLFLRLREGLKEAVGHNKYPFKIGIAIPFGKSIKMMSVEENGSLMEIEEAICKSLETNEDAVLSMVITGFPALVGVVTNKSNFH